MIDASWARVLATAALWSSWCVVHSLLNSEGPLIRTGMFQTSFGRYYRLVYNLVAVASLVFVYRLTPQGHEIALWEWNGPFRVVQFSLWAIAALIFYESFRLLDVVRFLGLRSPRRARSLANGGSGLVTTCIYGVLRHPQFAAGLIALWSRDLTDTGLVINVVLSLYLIIGAHIEESRLLARYGEAYARYMREVPRFIPRLRSRWRSVAR